MPQYRWGSGLGPDIPGRPFDHGLGKVGSKQTAPVDTRHLMFPYLSVSLNLPGEADALILTKPTFRPVTHLYVQS